jgi:hypothetical protein
MAQTKIATSIRLSPEAMELRRSLSALLGIDQTAVVELALRKLAQAEGISTKAGKVGAKAK